MQRLTLALASSLSAWRSLAVGTRVRKLLQALRRHPAYLLLIVLVLGLAGWGGRRVWALWHYRAAQQALERRAYDQARAHLRRYLQVRPADAQTHFLLARTARRAGAYGEAKEHLDQCAELGGDSAGLALERALLQAQQGNVGGLDGYLLSSVKQDHPDSVFILEALAQGYLQNYHLPLAQYCVHELIRRQPEHAEAHLWQGRVWDRVNKPAAAVEAYRRAVERDPQQQEARLRLAELLVEGKRFAEAETHFQFVRDRDAGNSRALVGLARCRCADGRFGEARQLIDAVLTTTPEHAEALTESGKLYVQNGQTAEAEEVLRRAVAAAPHDSNTTYTLVLCLRLRGKDAEAQRYLNALNRIETDQRRFDEVINKLIRAPDDPALLYEAGVICLRNGADQPGLVWLAKVLRADPRHGPTHQALADYHARKGDPALAEYHRSLAQQAQSAAKLP
jgi:tetratricopeptide (TPR) repeat protein